MNYLEILMSLCLLFNGCGDATVAMQEKPNTSIEKSSAVTAFSKDIDFNAPSSTIELPNELSEISGISIMNDGKTLAAINDEEGDIFLIDYDKSLVRSSYNFWKDGDYEGVEVIGNDIYVVKSTGTIYQIKNGGTEGQSMEKFNNSLEGEQDVEGLGYLASQNSLLLACKGESIVGDKETTKEIYTFSLTDMKLNEQPLFTIKLSAIQAFLKANPTLNAHAKMTSFFNNEDRNLRFSPSAIAVQPSSGDYFILSSVGKLLMIFDTDFNIKNIIKLNKKVHRQPEGLAFDTKGNLYISNEGKDGIAKIHKFETK